MIKNKLTSLLSASLLLAACSGTQNTIPTLNTGAAGLSPEQNNQNAEQANSPVIDDNLANLPADGGYRSLVITAKDIKSSDFKTKQVFAVAPKRNVTIRIGTVDYTLSYKFMNKLRTLLVNASYRAANGAAAKNQGNTYAGIVPAGFFTRLKATSTASVASDATNPLWCPEVAPASTPAGCVGNPNADAYTLSASELAFVTLLETYNFVSLPDFLQEDEGSIESSDSYDALTDVSRNIRWVNTKTIRKEFYQKLHSYLNSQRNLANYTHGNGDYVYYSENLNPAGTISASNIKTNNYNETVSAPTGSLYRMNVAGVSTGGTTPLATTAVAPAIVPAASTAEKALLTSFVNMGPFIANVGLLSGNNVVIRNVGIGFGLNDTLAADGYADSAYEMAVGYGTANLNATASVDATTWSTYLGMFIDNTPNFKLPANTANLNGAAAVMLAKLMIDDDNEYNDAMTNLGATADYGTYLSGDKYSMEQWEILLHTRALHMKAGKASATVVPAPVLGFPAASSTVTSTTHFLTPTATTGTTAPVIAEIYQNGTNAPTATGTSTVSDVEFRNDIAQTAAAVNIFDALYEMFGDPSWGSYGRRGVFKLGKSGASTNKQLAAITRFFHADDPTDPNYVYTDDANEDDVVKTRALIVPVTRTVATTGAVSYTLSPTGTNYVVITATTPSVGNGDNSLIFYLTDPGYKPLEGSASVNISASNPTLVAALYNYTGTLIGVSGDGF